MALPGMKLGILVLKTLAKPIAAKLKQQAGVHPRFRELIISIAQANHRMSTNAQRRIYGHATDVEIHPLNEEKAVQASVDLFGEVFIFSVGGAVVIFEVQRSSRSEARKLRLACKTYEVGVKRWQTKRPMIEQDVLKMMLSYLSKNLLSYKLRKWLLLYSTSSVQKQ